VPAGVSEERRPRTAQLQLADGTSNRWFQESAPQHHNGSPWQTHAVRPVVQKCRRGWLSDGLRCAGVWETAVWRSQQQVTEGVA